MVVISDHLAIYKYPNTLNRLYLIAMFFLTTYPPNRICKNEDTTTAMRIHLNVKCDFERIPGGGCHLRESYCSLHTCICKPDYPINIADRLCIAKRKTISEQCTFSQECQKGSFCAEMNNNRVCQCKRGHAYSIKSKLCVKGLKGSVCRNHSECIGENQFCSLSVCDCMYGFEWFAPDEACHKKSRYGESCDSAINCKIYDEFSECDLNLKQCTCGQFLSRKYALDEVTDKCVSCPPERYNNSTNTCLPQKTTVKYSLLDRSTYERNSYQYVYVGLSMTPLIVFAMIGFIYRYVSPSGNSPEQPTLLDQVASVSGQHNLDFTICMQMDFNGNPLTMNHSADSTTNLAQVLSSPIMTLPPPPAYEIVSEDLPPSYDEAVRQQA